MKGEVYEEWCPIKDYEGLYEISNMSRVKSLKRKGVRQDRILTPELNHKGYYRVVLCKNGRRKFYSIHILTANAFLDKTKFKSMPYEDRAQIDINKLEVNHINEFCKTDNSINNLEWCTGIYNINYGTRKERTAQKFRKRVAQYNLNGSFIAVYDGVRVASRQTKIDNGAISKCCQGLRSSAGGYIWKYEEEDKI